MASLRYCANVFVLLSVLLINLIGLSACKKSSSASDQNPTVQTSEPTQSSETAEPVATPPYDGSEGGFYTSQSVEIPAAVKATANSLFKILVPLESAAETIDTRFLRGPGLRAEIERSGLSEPAKIATLRQIEACEAEQGFTGFWAPESCKISRKYSTGTAFLYGSGRTLWTALHVVKKGIGFKQVLKDKSAKWPIFIFNSEGQLLADSISGRFEIQAYPDQARASYFLDIFVANLDYFSVSVDRDLGVPLNKAAVEPGPEERIFIANYTPCTGCTMPSFMSGDFSDRSPRPNSDGRSLTFTIGKSLNVDEFEKFRPMNAVEKYEFDPTSLRLVRADGVGGHSGGPALNEKGEVLGISLISTERSVDGKVDRMSSYLDFFSLTMLALEK